MSTPVAQRPSEPSHPQPCPPPQTIPHLPVVQFLREKPRLRAFYASSKADAAARKCAEGEFFDVRGIELSRSRDGSLVAEGEPHPGRLQRRLIEAVRELAADQSHAGARAELAAVIRWLELAPTPEYTVNALGARPAAVRQSAEWKLSSLQCSATGRLRVSALLSGEVAGTRRR